MRVFLWADNVMVVTRTHPATQTVFKNLPKALVGIQLKWKESSLELLPGVCSTQLLAGGGGDRTLVVTPRWWSLRRCLRWAPCSMALAVWAGRPIIVFAGPMRAWGELQAVGVSTAVLG